MSKMQEHIERLTMHIEQGTLIRGAWRGSDANGRKTACLLAAMVPECGEQKSARACPATVMPPWLAQLTPSLDDLGSLEAWPGMARRFAALASRWHVLDAAAWRRVQFTWLAVVVREAKSHTQSESVRAVCDRVAALCDGVVASGVVDAVAFESAGAAADEASDAWAARASPAATRAAWAAATAAEAASDEASDAWAVTAATAAEDAWDRMTVALFDALERELASC